MKSYRFVLTAILFALFFANVAAARAQDVCNKLSEDEVAAAVGSPLQRSPTNPCRFGRAMKSFSIIMHYGDGPGFSGYAAQSRKEFKDTQNVSGIGSDAIFFGGGNLAVKAKNDVIFIQMLMGKTPAEKLALSKAVAQKIIAHM
jgi:hypothetical protein